jgi:PPOX class probable F420-dependent enzyme
MAIELSPTCYQRLVNEQIIWLTTVSAVGQPLPTPVWFLWMDSHALIYSQPDALKIRNVLQNPRVALNFNGAEHGSTVMVLTGEAALDPNGASAAEHVAYLDKYARSIVEIGYTPERFVAQFSAVLRIRPRRVRVIE